MHQRDYNSWLRFLRRPRQRRASVDHRLRAGAVGEGADRLDRNDQATREQVIAVVIETFDYPFTGLIGADLTARQSVFLRSVGQ